jgi:hypothetical protein
MPMIQAVCIGAMLVCIGFLLGLLVADWVLRP